MPNCAGVSPPNAEEVVGFGELTEVWGAEERGERLSSLFELALDGGRGDGDARDALGELAERPPEEDRCCDLEDCAGIPGMFIIPAAAAAAADEPCMPGMP